MCRPLLSPLFKVFLLCLSVLSLGGQCFWREWWGWWPGCVGSAVWWRPLGTWRSCALQTCGHGRLSKCDWRAVWSPYSRSAWSARHEFSQPTQFVAFYGGCLHPAQPGATAPWWALIITRRHKSWWFLLCSSPGPKDVEYLTNDSPVYIWSTQASFYGLFILSLSFLENFIREKILAWGLQGCRKPQLHCCNLIWFCPGI